MTTGRLQRRVSGFLEGKWACIDCGHVFYSVIESESVIDAKVRYGNDKTILLCPWCRPDNVKSLDASILVHS